jgi:hypothetical protein
VHVKAPKGNKKAKKVKKANKSRRKPIRRDIGAAIQKLDVSSLHSDAITDVMLHCASALKLRKTMSSRKAALAKSSPSYCYTKAGDDPTVSIWSGGFKVGEMSETEAHGKGIPPCG